DPVVSQARDILVAGHPEGARLASAPLPPRGTREERIRALLSALGDPSTRLIPARDWPAFLAEVSDQPTVGVGLRELLDVDLAPDGAIVVITTQPGGAAARAGLVPREVIARIDGQPVADLTTAGERLRGPAGSDVRLELRKGAESRSVTLRREAL